MTAANARAIVEEQLIASFAGSGLALLLDQNPPMPYKIPDGGAVLLSMAPGPKRFAGSGGAGTSLLSFVVEIDAPKGVGDGQAIAWAEQVTPLFFSKVFPAPLGDTGQIETDSVTAPVIIGNDPDGRNLFITQAHVAFVNRSY